MHVHPSLQRLSFALPAFTRIAWVSDAAKSVWEPRLQSLAEKCRQVKLQMLQEGYFSCMVLQLAAWEYLKIKEKLHNTGLHHAILETINAYEPENFNGGFVKPISFKIVIGDQTNVALFENAFYSRDHYSSAGLLGIPSCCRDFYHEKHVKEGWKDLSWFRALNNHHLNQTGAVADVSCLPQLNLFWKVCGIGAIPYRPCSFDCTSAAHSGDDFFRTGELLGLHEEIGWLRNILSWPVEWSALHGIAEIKTPVLRISTNTDATGQKLVIRLRSETYPEEGAKGLHFPFQQPQFKRISDSKAFHMGLDNEIKVYD